MACRKLEYVLSIALKLFDNDNSFLLFLRISVYGLEELKFIMICTFVKYR